MQRRSGCRENEVPVISAVLANYRFFSGAYKMAGLAGGAVRRMRTRLWLTPKPPTSHLLMPQNSARAGQRGGPLVAPERFGVGPVRIGYGRWRGPARAASRHRSTAHSRRRFTGLCRHSGRRHISADQKDNLRRRTAETEQSASFRGYGHTSALPRPRYKKRYFR